jgi:mono/diheme cytochrome c family protein
MRHTKQVVLALGMGAVFFALAQAQTQRPTPTHPKANVAAGKELFHQHCSICHGEDARGFGSMYDPDSGEPSRRVPPANLTILTERNRGKFPADRVRNSIYAKDPVPAHGTPEMPAWGDVFYSLKSRPAILEQRVRDLTAYIESIQTAKK